MAVLDRQYWTADALGLRGPRFLQSAPPTVRDSVYYAPLFDWQRAEPALVASGAVDANAAPARKTSSTVLSNLPFAYGPEDLVVTCGSDEASQAIVLMQRGVLDPDSLGHLAYVTRHPTTGSVPIANAFAAFALAVHQLVDLGAVGYTAYFESDEVRSRYSAKVPFYTRATDRYSADPSLQGSDVLADPAAKELTVKITSGRVRSVARVDGRMEILSYEHASSDVPTDVSLSRAVGSEGTVPRLGQLLRLNPAGLGAMDITDGPWRLLRFLWSSVASVPHAETQEAA